MVLSITDISRVAGVPTSTLRYYDRLGLLSSAGRADNGYRQYDERALDRLRFIARAKELGCSLDEIASLLTAFDQNCGDVQGTLRELVGRKIAIAQRRVAELVALTEQLQGARHALSTASASGPCGPGCACVGEAPRSSRSLDVIRLPASEAPIACTLGHQEMGDRIAEWQAVFAGVEETTPIDGGVRLKLGGDVDFAEITRLARAESQCCTFFAFAITVDGRGTALEVRAPDVAAELLKSVFGGVE
ncbi:MAG: MerR family transcriptional regulator [Chloroflexota bacterium]|nr:MerR family transcriptional regulator [Chloroflexota bacterium]